MLLHTCTKGTITAETQSNKLSILIPAIGSVPVSTLSKLRSHIVPEMAHDKFTIVNMQTAGAKSSFKYLSSLRNSDISWKNPLEIILFSFIWIRRDFPPEFDTLCAELLHSTPNFACAD